MKSKGWYHWLVYSQREKSHWWITWTKFAICRQNKHHHQSGNRNRLRHLPKGNQLMYTKITEDTSYIMHVCMTQINLFTIANIFTSEAGPTLNLLSRKWSWTYFESSKEAVACLGQTQDIRCNTRKILRLG
jgi:hypothetical protein